LFTVVISSQLQLYITIHSFYIITTTAWSHYSQSCFLITTTAWSHCSQYLSLHNYGYKLLFTAFISSKLQL